MGHTPSRPHPHPTTADATGDALDSLIAEHRSLVRRRPSRSLRRSDEAIRARLEQIDDDLPTAASLRQLDLVQERLDLRAELDRRADAERLRSVEHDMVSILQATPIAGEDAATWRARGVPAAVLRRAGLR